MTCDFYAIIRPDAYVATTAIDARSYEAGEWYEVASPGSRVGATFNLHVLHNEQGYSMKADDCLFGTASVERKTKRDVARQMDCFTDLIDADADNQKAIATNLSDS